MRALVRIANAAGRTASASSTELEIDDAPPSIRQFVFDGYRQGVGPACVLNRSQALMARWLSDDEGSGLLSHEIVAIPYAAANETQDVDGATLGPDGTFGTLRPDASVQMGVYPATSHNTSIDLPSGLNPILDAATGVRFMLTATDRSRLQTSVHIDCQVARSAPQMPAAAVKMPDALELRRLRATARSAICH